MTIVVLTSSADGRGSQDRPGRAASHERGSLSARPVPDCEHLEDFAGDPVVDVVARAPHEDVAHARKVVVVGGRAERWRVCDQPHCFFELSQEQVRCGATVCLPPPVNRSRVLGSRG